MQSINTYLFQSLNNLSQFDSISFAAPLLADLPIFFLPIFLLFMWIKYSFSKQTKEETRSKKQLLLQIFYSAIAAIIISLIIQQFVDIDRPETAIAGAGKLLLEHIPDASFPSDHASVSFAFLFALYFTGYTKVFWIFMPWVILMNLSRIISGVHWPFDVIAGTGVGFIGAYISCKKLSEIKLVKKLNLFIIQILETLKF